MDIVQLSLSAQARSHGGAMGGLAPPRISLATPKGFYLEAKNAKIQA